MSQFLEAVNVTLFGKKVFADVNEYLKLKRSGLSRCVLSPVTGVLVRDTQGRFDIDRTGGGNVKTEAEARVMQLQAEECWQHQKVEEPRNRISPRSFKGGMTLPIS